MSSERNPMICPSCGVAMNLHAEKLVTPLNAEQAGQMDEALGGMVEEFHACPKCGGGASRFGG